MRTQLEQDSKANCIALTAARNT